VDVTSPEFLREQEQLALRMQDVAELAAIEHELRRRQALSSLKTFIQHAWHIVEPEHTLVWNWHLDVLCDVLQRMAVGRLTNVIINVPPGTMKSLLVSVFYRAWLWARNPKFRFIAASYGAHLSLRDNARFRDIITSLWYQEWFPDTRIAGDQDAKQRFDTTQEGYSIATSVQGVGTGEHPDFVIIDDPHTAQQATSEAERQSACDWFDRTISTRGVVRNVRVAVIMQRLHQRDLTGHLLERGGWEHYCFPMRYSLDHPDPRDPRREIGELLWPALFDEERVKKLELGLGPYGTASQLQQRPAPEGGGLFKREWFRVIETLPSDTPVATTRFWDCASTEGAGDYTVGTKMLRYRNGLFVVADVVRGRWNSGAVDDIIRQTAVSDGRRVRIREEQEGGSSGKTVIATRTKSMVGYDYKGARATGEKTTRWQPLLVQAAAGNVALLAGEWNRAWLEELTMAPYAEHDDQADSAAGAFNDLALVPLSSGAVALTGF
jgi:predicted phage terminase large subunit-like protein